MHECRVDGGRAHCDCKVGYILVEDGKTCEGKIVMVFLNFFFMQLGLIVQQEENIRRYILKIACKNI